MTPKTNPPTLAEQLKQELEKLDAKERQAIREFLQYLKARRGVQNRKPKAPKGKKP